MARYKNCIYRFLNDNNEIIYIGKAKNLKQRLSSHTHLPEGCYDEVKEIEFIMFDTEDDMDFAERYYIPKYNPIYNTIWSERKITLSIPDLDNKHWLKYTNDKDIEIQILKLEGKWTEPKVLVTKEDYDREINLLKEELKDEKSNRDSIIDKQRRLMDEMDNTAFMKEMRSKGNVYFDRCELAFRNLKTWDILDVEFNEEFEEKCIRYNILDEEFKYTTSKMSELEKELIKLKEKRLLIVLGKENVKKLDKVLYNEYIKYGVYSKDELLVCKIKYIRDKYVNQYKETVESRGFYDINTIINMVYSDMGIGIRPDEWANKFKIQELETAANICVEEIKDKFAKMFGEFKQELILSNETSMLAPRYKIPTALLVMKLVA